MKIYGQIVKGPQKTECEDSAFIYLKDSDPIFLNESRFEYDVKLPFAIGLADGVGGNPGAAEGHRLLPLKLFHKRFPHLTYLKKRFHLL